MSKFIGVISKIKWIGMIGVIGNLIYPSRTLKLIGLFMLLGLVEIFYNIPMFIQSLQQVLLLPYIYIVHGFRLPSKDNYRCKTEFILPFEGRWAVVNGSVEKTLSHSWGMLPQRYAYDFLILNEEGRSFHDLETEAMNYYCYGQKVLAPADGVVVQASQRMSDSKIYGDGKIDYNIKDIRGNYIIIKHNKHEYSFIAHIKPGSILVKKGQEVRQGEEIARCGNSGNSSEPHIHFHVQDGKSVFSSAGLPVCFKHVNITKEEYYTKYDTRPLPEIKEDSNAMEGYIHRGQFVETVQ